jgi:hypothetical protein
MLLSAGGQAAAQDMCLLVPWHLLGQLPNEHLIFLVQGKEDGGESERKWRGRQRKET